VLPEAGPDPTPARAPRVAWIVCLLVLLATSGLGVALGWVHCWRSDYHALALSIPDDTYYFLLPAFRFRDSGFFTFDGIHSTYGFEPLWELVLGALGLITRDREVFLRLALFVPHVLRALTAWVLFITALDARPSRAHPPNLVAGLLAAHLFLLNWPFRDRSTLGMENALYALLLALVLRLCLNARPGQLASNRRSLAAGIAIGLLPLTRLGVPTLAVALAVGVVLARQASARPRWMATGCALVDGAWSLYAFHAFGAVFPVSGAIKLEATLGSFRERGFLDQVPDMLRLTARYLIEALRMSFGWASRFGEGGAARTRILPAILSAVLVASLARRGSRSRGVPMTRRALACAGAATAGMAAVPGLLWGWHEGLFDLYWYIVELPVLVPLVLASTVCVRRTATTILAVVLGALFVTDAVGAARTPSALREPAPHEDWQNVILRATLYANDALALSPAVKVGAHNAGLAGYFSKGTLVNLDGLANNSIFWHTRAGRSRPEYVRNEGIRYLIDPEVVDGLVDGKFAFYRVLHQFPFAPEGTTFDGYDIAETTELPFPAFPVLPGVGGGRVVLKAWSDPPVFGIFRNQNIFLIPGLARSSSIRFETEGHYQELRATAGLWPVDAKGAASGSLTLKVVADGRLVLERVLEERASPVPLVIDVSGIDRVVAEVSGTGTISACLADTRFAMKSSSLP